MHAVGKRAPHLAIGSFIRCVPSHDEAASQDTDRSAMRRVSPADARHATPQLSWDARVCRMQLGAVARCSAIMRWRIARGCDCIAGGGEASGDASASCDECDLGMIDRLLRHCLVRPVAFYDAAYCTTGNALCNSCRRAALVRCRGSRVDASEIDRDCDMTAPQSAARPYILFSARGTGGVRLCRIVRTLVTPHGHRPPATQ